MQMQFVQQLVERLRDECFERCVRIWFAQA
jgi:hypothetical protein